MALNNDELLRVLQGLLRKVLEARFDGGAHAKLCRASGYADGYMRALLDAGLVEEDRLRDMVGEERRRYVEAT